VLNFVVQLLRDVFVVHGTVAAHKMLLLLPACL
jgi:hypothetical protein